MPTLDPESVAATLSAIVRRSLGPRPGRLAAEPAWRWWRWVCEPSADLVGFLAEDESAWARLEREAALLARLESRVPFEVPTVLHVARPERVQLRRRIRGTSGFPVEHVIFGHGRRVPAAARYAPGFPITVQGRYLARDLGRMLGALHGAVTAVEASALGFGTKSYGAICDAIDARLAKIDGVADLRTALPRLRRWLEGLPPDPVLAHGDVQFHNLAIDPATGGLVGIFDFEEAVVAHRLDDLKYLPSIGIEFTDLALAMYAEVTGARPSLDDVGLFHVFSALAHFTHVAPDTPRWPQIVEWSRAALVRFAPGWCEA